jgi:hypothetical protein
MVVLFLEQRWFCRSSTTYNKTKRKSYHGKTRKTTQEQNEKSALKTQNPSSKSVRRSFGELVRYKSTKKRTVKFRTHQPLVWGIHEDFIRTLKWTAFSFLGGEWKRVRRRKKRD